MGRTKGKSEEEVPVSEGVPPAPGAPARTGAGGRPGARSAPAEEVDETTRATAQLEEELRHVERLALAGRHENLKDFVRRLLVEARGL